MRSRHRNIFEKHGDVFFITFTVVGFIPIFNNTPCCDIMLDNLRFYQERGDFAILAYVIMPNHVHLVLKVHGGRPASQCIGGIKRMTSRQISIHLARHGKTELLAALSDAAHKEPARDCRIWKPRFDSLVLHNIDTLCQKIHYIHNNPVKAGLVDREIDWPYSSAGAYAGLPETDLLVDSDWCSLGFDRLRSGKGS